MKLIVGLGNPGAEYRDTRHNVGFRCVDAMAGLWAIPTRERRAKVVLGTGCLAGTPVVLAKPRSFMNNSGEGVSYLMARFGGCAGDLVIIYDDMELPAGRLRIRPSGSAGGHNGVSSIIAAARTDAFPRIRVGIGAPPGGQDRVSYVLGRFSGEEEDVIAPAVERVAAAVRCILEEGINAAMNRFNGLAREGPEPAEGTA